MILTFALAVAVVPIGSVAQWVTLFALLGSAWIFTRGGTGTAVRGLTDTNQELERQLKERDGKISALERINAELRATKDVTLALVPVIEAMQNHETRAQERHEAAMNLQSANLRILEMIGTRLGPDENGHSID